MMAFAAMGLGLRYIVAQGQIARDGQKVLVRASGNIMRLGPGEPRHKSSVIFG